MLLWIENAPDFSTSDAIPFIDSVVTCRLPDEGTELGDLVRNLQIHKCTPSCFKNGKRYCRHGFPRKISEETKMLSEDEAVLNNGKTFLLRRNENERNVNNYNETLLRIWGANIDIQPVGSVYGIAYYIAKYVSKAETETLRSEISDAIKLVRSSENSNLARSVNQAARLIMSQRERSAQEAAYICCGCNLKGSSRSLVYINTRSRELRSRLLKNEAISKDKDSLKMVIFVQKNLKNIAIDLKN
jgi:hypothetical protein